MRGLDEILENLIKSLRLNEDRVSLRLEYVKVNYEDLLKSTKNEYILGLLDAISEEMLKYVKKPEDFFFVGDLMSYLGKVIECNRDKNPEEVAKYLGVVELSLYYIYKYYHTTGDRKNIRKFLRYSAAIFGVCDNQQ